MSNLSDLLPAGAAAKQLTFTDSGSGISSKAPVILNSDGTVTGVGNVGASFGSADVWTTGSVSQIAAGYDSDNNRVCVVYIDGDNSSYGMAVVGQISGSSITWGTPVTFNSAYSPYPDIDYDTGTNQFVISFVDGGNSNYLGLITAAYAATNSLTFGTKVSGPEYAGSSSVACSSSAFIAVYDTNYGFGIAGTISGTSITLGTKAAYAGGGTYARGSAIIYDTNEAKFLIATADGSNSNNGYGFVATLSGTSISYGSGSTFNTTSSNSQNLAYDSTAQKSVVMYMDLTATNIQACVGTISGTSVSFGSPTEVLPNYDVSMQTDRNLCYDPASNKTYVTYRKNSDNYGYLLTGTVSGTSISFADETAFTSATTSYTTFTVDTTNNKLAIVYINSSSTNDGTSKVYSPAGTNLTAQAFVGIADSAISASAAGSIIVQGGTVGGISLGTGISLGATSTVEAVDPLDLRYNGLNIYDSTNNKHIIVYSDAGALNAGHGAVGTISGTTVSYGTPVVFQSQYSEYFGGAYDSTNEKVLVCYRGYDTGQNFYMHGVVGTVSGTSISWGTPVALNSTSSYLTSQGVQFDSNTGKFLVCYQDGGSSNNAAALVATVSGTSVSAGTPVSFDSTGSTFHHCVSYDANAQKFLVTWTRQSNYYAYAAVATISGTSVSFGSTLNWYSASSYYQRVNYDANAQKHLSVYTLSNSNGLAAAVATISGTSVTYGSGTNIVADTIAVNPAPEQTYDSTAQKMLIFANVGNSSPEPMIAYTGTISGTSVTVSSGTTILSGNNYFIGQSTYNPSANKTLVLWELSGTSLDSAVGTLGDLPLTTGTKYYVTTSGGFSSSADTPSVNAGLAISTTSLLLNGDS